MGVCRRSRVLKLVLCFSVLVTCLLHFFPTEFRSLMARIAPPTPLKDQQQDSLVLEEKREDETMRHKERSRSEHEPYLTPDALGNFEPMREESYEGPGERGVPYAAGPKLANKVEQSINTYGINMVVSDIISLDRTIPDTRLGECKNWNYPTALPKASVVLVFHNEGRSVLLRTVHSIINRTPGQLLEEVLLVDDFSDRAELATSLENYIKIFRGVVRLIRNTEREGLIRSRTRGAKEARGVVVVFLDAHCEVNRNWLPPLLAPIYRNYTTMTVPIIDGIDHETFEYKPVYQGSTHFRGIFEWGMLYKETELPEQEAKKREHDSQPYPSPTHAGGLFAINREYFLSLGGYDPGLLVWGGENFELSFKIWQCGGSILWVPCSRVGHVYRSFMPYGFGSLTEGKKGPIITINYKRVVEVWMDPEYKEYFYTREPMARYTELGDISEQLALKKRLQCKSFHWFMTNIAYDMLEEYPRLPKNVAVGALVSESLRRCVDTWGRSAPSVMGLATCYGQEGQTLRLNARGQLGTGERCVDVSGGHIKQIYCPSGSVEGPWNYNNGTKLLHHISQKKCLKVARDGKNLELDVCNEDNESMKWSFQETKPSWAP